MRFLRAWRAVACLSVAGAASVFGVASAGAEGDDVPMPEIVVYLHDAGGDAIDYYDTGLSHNPVSLMRDIAHAFGRVPDEPFINDYRQAFEDYRTVGAQFDGRLALRRGADLRLEFDTRRLSQVMARVGYDSYLLTLCPPDVDYELSASVAAGEDDGGCAQWAPAIDAPPVQVELLVVPDAGEYGRVVLGIALAAAIGSIVAALVVILLRRSLLRSFGGGALVVAAIGVVGAAAPAFVGAIVLAGFHRPVSSLVLAHDLGVGQQIIATLLPAVALMAPGTVLAVLALRAPIAIADDAPVRESSPTGPGMPTWLNR